MAGPLGRVLRVDDQLPAAHLVRPQAIQPLLDPMKTSREHFRNAGLQTEKTILSHCYA